MAERREHRAGERLREPEATATRPKILLIVDRVPGVRSGYGMRVANVIDGLATAGDVHVCLLDSSPDCETLPDTDSFTSVSIRAVDVSRRRKMLRSVFSVLPVHVKYRNHREVRALVRREIESQSWDLIWCSRLRTYVVSSGVGTAPRIVDFDDLGDRLALSAIRDRIGRRRLLQSMPHNIVGVLDAPRWRRLQRRAAREAERVLVCSEEDRRFLRMPNASVVPNGYPKVSIDDGSTDLPAAHRRPHSLLFVGPLTYEPNELAVEWFVREVLPQLRVQCPDATLVVVGTPSAATLGIEHTEGVVFAGWVPDVGPYYRQAAAAITPLHSGGGTRLKVIEAFARNVPLVSTSFAFSGLPVTPDRHALVADDPIGFADACRRAIVDTASMYGMVERARRLYEDHLTSHVSSRAVRDVALEFLRAPIGAHDDARA